MLLVGGRAPNSTVHVLMGTVCCDITWRTQRAALLLKLANAPVGSWHHLALIAHHHYNTAWFKSALADVALVFPGTRFIPTFVRSEPYLSSTGRWTDEGAWKSFHAQRLPTNISGLRYRPCTSGCSAEDSKSVKFHVKYASKQLNIILVRQMWTEVYDSIISTSHAPESSKLAFLARRLQSPGLPLHLALDLVALPCHRTAMASFFCADWFFGKYAHNYFAQNLLPKIRHRPNLLLEDGRASDTVCLACWHNRRISVPEDEFHVACVCPEYCNARRDLMTQLPQGAALNTTQDLLDILSGNDAAAFRAAAQFLARARQTKRRQKLTFERLSSKLEATGFIGKRAAWRLKRKPCCRHGVLFTKLPPSGCQCMSTNTTHDAWQDACFMPSLDHELKDIVAVRFDQTTLQRLAVLQAQARALGWQDASLTQAQVQAQI